MSQFNVYNYVSIWHLPFSGIYHNKFTEPASLDLIYSIVSVRFVRMRWNSGQLNISDYPKTTGLN